MNNLVNLIYHHFLTTIFFLVDEAAVEAVPF